MASSRALTAPRAFAPARLNLGDAGAWLLAASLTVYLGMRNGGYDAIVREEIGVAVNWLLVVGVLSGLFALHVSRSGLMITALLTFLAIWTAASFVWTESAERTADELTRISSYIGVLMLAMAVAASGRTRQMAHGLLAGMAAIVVIAVLSRLVPEWFPASVIGEYLAGIDIEERLAYPLNYASALGAFAAMAVPLTLWSANDARTNVGALLAAALLPVLGLCIYLTTSGGAVIVAFAAVVTYLMLAADRVPLLCHLGLGMLGTLILAQGVDRRPAVDRGIHTAAAEQQGHELLILVLLTSAGVALISAGVRFAWRYGTRPAWMSPPKRTTTIVSLACAMAAIVVAGAAGGTSQLDERWDTFKDRSAKASPLDGTRGSQILSFSSSGRYEFWITAANAAEAHPWTGTGAGTFEYWWARHGTYSAFVRDSHSLYFDALGELGWPGLALVVALVLGTLWAGTLAVLRGPPARRPLVAAATASCAAFAVAAGLDWVWEMAVMPIVFLVLVAVAIGQPRRVTSHRTLVARVIPGVTAALALLIGLVSLASDSAVRDSEQAVQSANLQQAFDRASRAVAMEPYAASPRLQQALVLERAGDLPGAIAAGRVAADKEPTNWRTTYVVARLEARNGNADAAVAALRRARVARPTSPLLAAG
jgi:hypothetical protein